MTYRFEFAAPFGPPATQPYCLPIVASQQLRSCLSRANIWLVPGAGGTEIAAISLAWDYARRDMRLMEWQASNVDATYLAQVSAIVQHDLDAVNADLAKQSTSELLERQAELQNSLATLRSLHFWEEQQNALGDNAVALYRSVSAANVPWSLASIDKVVGTNRAFTVHFYRSQLPAGQAQKRFQIRWDNFLVEFPSDGPEAKVYVFNPALSVADRTAKIDAANALEAKRTLSAQEESDCETRRNEAETLKNDLRTRAAFYKGNKAEKTRVQTRIEEIRKQNADLKATKKLTPAEEQTLATLVRELYAAKFDANLGLDTQTGTDTRISLTFVPDPRGYLIIHANPGDKTVVHELKWLTATGRFGTVWKSSKLTLVSDGGAAMVRFDYPRVRRWGSLVSCRHQLAQKPGPVSFASNVYKPAGTSITPTSSVDETVLSWELQLESTDEVSFPFVYTMTLESSGTPRSSSDKTLHLLDGTLACDYVPTIQEGRRSANVSLMDPDGSRTWLAGIENYQVRVFDRNKQVLTGVAKNVRFAIVGLRARKWEFEIVDRWCVLEEDVMWHDPPGDAKELGAYLGQLVRNRGFKAAEVLCADTGIILPHAAEGEKYLLNPQVGSRRGEWIRQLMENHAIRVGARFDALGRFVVAATATQADKTYRFHRDPAKAGKLRQACFNVNFNQNFSEFYNIFTVLGAENPATGTRFASKWINWSSVRNPDSPTYYGSWREYAPVQDDSLRSQDDCARVCRRLAEKYGQPAREWEFVTYFDAALREGDWVFFEDLPVEVVGIASVSAKRDRMTVTVKELPK